MTITQIIGLIVVLCLAALGGFFIVKNGKKNDLVKWLLLFILVAISFTWIFEGGYYQGTEYYATGLKQIGLTDIPNLLYYAIGFSSDKIIFLVALGILYGVLSKSESYKKLVNNFANMLKSNGSSIIAIVISVVLALVSILISVFTKNYAILMLLVFIIPLITSIILARKYKRNEIVAITVISFVFTTLATFLNQTFVALAFVPFMVSVILSMKLDKMTAFSATFGSILIGLLGVTYGFEGLTWFNQYCGTTITTAILYRLIVLVVAFILFNFFNILHTKKVMENNKLNDLDSDPFKVEKVDKKAMAWPLAVMFVVLFIYLILSYVSWEGTFGITIFSKFHEWLTGLKIGEFAPFSVIIGSLGGAFGSYEDLFNASIILFVFTILFALLGGVKFNEFIEGCKEGLKKISLPLVLFVGTYVLMLAVYINPIMSAINNVMFKNITTFNPFLTTFTALLANTFHADFGLTGLLVGSYFTSTYAANVPVIHTIFTTMYGFVQLFLPTSGILLIGLSYLNIEYKSWIKYVWMFAIGMLVILLVLFTVMTYV